MATSSITKNFVISGQRQVEMFADAIEASANDQTPSIKVNATFLTDPKDIANIYAKNTLSMFCASMSTDNWRICRK